jgi:cholesterol transport system auxiliary component
MSVPMRASLRLLAFACVAATLVTACGLVPKKDPLSLYAPEARVSPDPAWPTVDWSLQIPRPHASELLDSPRIVVRPVNGELQVYHGAVWAEPVPDLVQDTVLHAFEDSGRITSVARPGAAMSGEYALVLDIRRFESDYAGGATPHADVEIVAKLYSSRDNVIVASRTLRQTIPANATAVGEVSRAFGTALSTVAKELVGWTLAEGQKHQAVPPTVGR